MVEATRAAREIPPGEQGGVAEQTRAAEESNAAEVVVSVGQAPAAEQASVAERAHAAEQAHAADMARAAEQGRVVEVACVAEQARAAERTRGVEEARLAEEARAAEEARIAEQARVAEEDRAVDEALALVGGRVSARPQPLAGATTRSLQQSSDGRAGQDADPSPDSGPGPVPDPTHGSGRRSAHGPGCGAAARNSGHSPGHSSGQTPARVPRGDAAVWSEARARAAQAGRGGSPRTQRVALDLALGHVLAEPVTALTDLPSFDTSAMDGWVVAGPGPWTVRAGEDGTPGLSILAGHSAPAPLPDGDAVRIATGARIPANATAVIRNEHAHTDEGKRLLYAQHQVVPGQDIRPRGQECRSGEQLLPAGTLVTPAVLGLSAAAGYDELVTVLRPRVDVLVLGDELLTAGLPHDGLIRDALGPMIGPWLRALGAEVSAPRRLGDDAEALRHALTTSDADLVITTGGTAAGPVDHVHPVLAKTGAELLVDGVAVRPGHPMLLARLPSGGPYLVGLPGNPLAAVSGLLTLAEPLLRGLAGRPPEETRRVVVRDEVHGHPHDTRLVPVVHRVAAGEGAGRAADGGDAGHVVPLHYNGPAMLRGIAAADGLAVVPPGGTGSGDELQILELPWGSATPWTGGCFT
ncbi:molybdopterin molybdotransferase MoeA [Streptomyces sp. NBC_00316]|uniref:molybdopterin molybdotransferase MoeA n=1 Tax=Streptomyces sp. NBC_00316 TaxID=2975710 RepID=UPI002E2A01A6|nr:molybdopterin-binding protein [Streptomyces sp. NBC_00316]